MAPVRTPIRCAIYTRQSVESHYDLSSCQVRFEVCLAWISSLRSLGFELIGERFDGAGYSGTTLDRPALQRLLEVLRFGGIERVVIDRLDRLSRNFRHFTTLFEELGEHKVALEIVTAPGMGNAAMDKLMLNVLGSFAEFERTSPLRESRRRIAGATPFVYSAYPHTKQLVVCDGEASAVVRMFQWAAQGVTPRVIAFDANALGWIMGGGKTVASAAGSIERPDGSAS